MNRKKLKQKKRTKISPENSKIFVEKFAAYNQNWDKVFQDGEIISLMKKLEKTEKQIKDHIAGKKKKIVEKTDQGQGMKLKDQIIDKNFENVNIPPKKANQPLKKR